MDPEREMFFLLNTLWNALEWYASVPPERLSEDQGERARVTLNLLQENYWTAPSSIVQKQVVPGNS